MPEFDGKKRYHPIEISVETYIELVALMGNAAEFVDVQVTKGSDEYSRAILAGKWIMIQSKKKKKEKKKPAASAAPPAVN